MYRLASMGLATPPCGVPQVLFLPPSSAGSRFRPVLQSGLSATSLSDTAPPDPRSAKPRTEAVRSVESYQRKPRHTTHPQYFPERVTITRPHHPFEGRALEVLRQVRMPAGLQLVLFLPDGSKSLIPADW